ncbi:hypothetical protein FHW67_002716 [Herbaspirillum sp. Sphag1AN]|uniref:hypothetical protein n=1 Tax=unclassified Herbaspirillum TaxID=2624150 RepID=UPI001612607B|nr:MULTISPECIES: hypothetical protein [unclassified Herbaspirillum]MBB3213424.1 hypothetical protein [Herbaspirillum sp. Sphag1AN]MBB3246532.1 hypothetical protein [Herbaspirillum sp. Sphag64]
MNIRYLIQEWLADRVKGIQYPQHQSRRHQRYSPQVSKKPHFADYVITGIAMFFLFAIGIGAIGFGVLILFALVQ